VTLTLARFTQLARLPLGRCAGSSALRRLPSVGSRQGARSLPCSTAKGLGWEPDGVTLQVRFCEEPGTNRRMAEILRHRRETRRQPDKANVCLHVGKDPAYFPTTFSTFYRIALMLKKVVCPRFPPFSVKRSPPPTGPPPPSAAAGQLAVGLARSLGHWLAVLPYFILADVDVGVP
jgi:hypothetical protein